MIRNTEPPRAATLAAVLARALPDARPGAIAHAVGAMIHAARAHKRDGEIACSYPRTEAQERRAARRLERLAMAAAEQLGACEPQATCGLAHLSGMSYVVGGEQVRTLRLDFGGDPRGPCGRLVVSDMPDDGWGDGWAIHS
jgi:hypothetical protein